MVFPPTITNLFFRRRWKSIFYTRGFDLPQDTMYIEDVSGKIVPYDPTQKVPETVVEQQDPEPMEEEDGDLESFFDDHEKPISIVSAPTTSSSSSKRAKVEPADSIDTALKALTNIVETNAQENELADATTRFRNFVVVTTNDEFNKVVPYGNDTQELIEAVVSHRRHIVLPKKRKASK